MEELEFTRNTYTSMFRSFSAIGCWGGGPHAALFFHICYPLSYFRNSPPNILYLFLSFYLFILHVSHTLSRTLSRTLSSSPSSSSSFILSIDPLAPHNSTFITMFSATHHRNIIIVIIINIHNIRDNSSDNNDNILHVK